MKKLILLAFILFGINTANAELTTNDVYNKYLLFNGSGSFSYNIPAGKDLIIVGAEIGVQNSNTIINVYDSGSLKYSGIFTGISAGTYNMIFKDTFEVFNIGNNQTTIYIYGYLVNETDYIFPDIVRHQTTGQELVNIIKEMLTAENINGVLALIFLFAFSIYFLILDMKYGFKAGSLFIKKRLGNKTSKN